MLWNRFCPGFPLRFGFCFRQLVDSFFYQMAGFLHGMVGGVCDLAALVAIFRLPILCCVAAPAEAAERKRPRCDGALPAAQI